MGKTYVSPDSIAALQDRIARHKFFVDRLAEVLDKITSARQELHYYEKNPFISSACRKLVEESRRQATARRTLLSIKAGTNKRPNRSLDLVWDALGRQIEELDWMVEELTELIDLMEEELKELNL